MARLPNARVLDASIGVLAEKYMGIAGTGYALFNSQTESEVVQSHGGRGDALLRHMPTTHYLTSNVIQSLRCILLTLEFVKIAIT